MSETNRSGHGTEFKGQREGDSWPPPGDRVGASRLHLADIAGRKQLLDLVVPARRGLESRPYRILCTEPDHAESSGTTSPPR